MLIGLNGFLGSGKDAVYKRIALGVRPEGLRGMRCERIAFADKLKLSAAAAFGVTEEYLDQEYHPERVASGDTKGLTHSEYRGDPIGWMNAVKDDGKITIESHGMAYVLTGRAYLQFFGTEAHRDVFDTNFWVNQALPWDYPHKGKIVCVTDVRFPNEIQRIKNLGGMLWRVIGPDQSSADTHASEVPIADNVADVDIANNIRDDDFEYLDSQIVRAFELSGRKFDPRVTT